MLIIEQQYDKTNKMISVPSKDSDQLGRLTSQTSDGHLTILTAIHIIFTLWE